MGPLLPIAILFGGLYMLDKEKQAEKQSAPQQPQRFTPLAVSMVATEVAGVRHFLPEVKESVRALLASHAVESVTIEGAPAGVLLFRLVAHEPGATIAADVVKQAESNGMAVLGALALALSSSSSDHLLLMGLPGDALRLANAKSAFAVLSVPGEKVGAVEPVVAPEPAEPPVTAAEVKQRIAKRTAVKNALRETLTNGKHEPIVVESPSAASEAEA